MFTPATRVPSSTDNSPAASRPAPARVLSALLLSLPIGCLA